LNPKFPHMTNKAKTLKKYLNTLQYKELRELNKRIVVAVA